MYGTAYSGGASGITANDSGAGMVWEITEAGTYKDLHDFGGKVTNADGSSEPDGANPAASTTFDSRGNMYGTTVLGGPNVGIENGYFGAGTVWMITASGTYKDLHDFGGEVTNADGIAGPDGSEPGASIVFDGAGNMYGTASRGGPTFSLTVGVYAGMVWEITAAGTYKDLHDFGGTVTNDLGMSVPDGVVPGGAVAFDSPGNMYGTAPGGGTYDGGILWEITVSGAYKDLHDFGGTVTTADGTSGLDGQNPVANVVFDSAGNAFGTAQTGGPFGGNNGYGASGMAWMLTPSGAYADLHDFGDTIRYVNGTSGSDGINPYAGVTFDSGGNIYGTAYNGGAYIDSGFGGMVWKLEKPIEPTVATPATATPSPVTGTKTNLLVLGAYTGKGGSTALTYTWSSTGPASVTFAANDTLAARNTIATFGQAGNYTLTATINGPLGQSTTSSVNVTVNQTLKSITVTPGPALTLGPPLPQTQQFIATALDQFGDALATQPAFIWSLASGGIGSISDAGGLYHSGKVAGTAMVKAKAGVVMGTCAVTVN